MVRFFACILFFMFWISTGATVVFNDTVKSEIRTLTLQNTSGFMAPNVIRLGSADKLRLNFDIPGETHRNLRARLVHCNLDWMPSSMMPSEICDGFNETEISDFEYSSGTFTHYVNYNLEFPDGNLNPLISGNYLIEIFDEETPEVTMAYEKFFVTEDAFPSFASMTTHTDAGVNASWQQIEASLDLTPGSNINPYSELILTIRQNNDPNSTRTITRPFKTKGTEIEYANSRNLVFPGGNEFRRFETTRADYPGMGIDSVSFADNIRHAWLSTDFPRTNTQHEFDATQHGRFKTDEYNSSDPDLSADYIKVHFFLKTDERPAEQIIVFGDLSRHNIGDFIMTYDSSKGGYCLEVPLKQGSYNYLYAAVPLGKSIENVSIFDCVPLEGSNFETNNEYLLNFYLRQPGTRADRLISSYFLCH